MAKEATAPATTGETVTVALKHPTGLVIQAYAKEVTHEPVTSGVSREVNVFRPAGTQCVLNGNRVPYGATPKFPIIGGYAMTAGVPKDVWDTWREQHADSPLVEQGLIFAHKSLDHAEGHAKDGTKLVHGMEPLQREGDPRIEKKRTRAGKFVDAIVQADEQPAAA